MDYEDRLEQLYRRLGTRHPICLGCCETSPFCMEQHHIAGKKHHGDISIVCRNCHRKLTVQQLYHVPPDTPEPTGELVTIDRYLLGLCDLLEMVVATLQKFDESLINESKR